MKKLLCVLLCLCLTQCGGLNSTPSQINWATEHIGWRSTNIDIKWKELIIKALSICCNKDISFQRQPLSAPPELFPYLLKAKNRHLRTVDPNALYKADFQFIDQEGNPVVLVCMQIEPSVDGKSVGILVFHVSNSVARKPGHERFFEFKKTGSNWKLVIDDPVNID